jgi:hypothetical protein
VVLIDPEESYAAAARSWQAARGGDRHGGNGPFDEDPYESPDRWHVRAHATTWP